MRSQQHAFATLTEGKTQVLIYSNILKRKQFCENRQGNGILADSIGNRSLTLKVVIEKVSQLQKQLV